MIDAILTYNSISIRGSEAGDTEFNYRDTSPYYIVALEVPNFDVTEVRESKEYKPGEEGVQDYESFLGMEKINMRLIVKAGTREYVNDGIKAIREAFHPKTVYYATDNDDGYLPLKFQEEGQVALQIDCTPYKLPVVVEVKNRGLSAKIDVFLKAKYPFRQAQIQDSLTLQTEAAATGNSEYSVTYPFEYGSDTGSTTGTAKNSGSFAVIPTAVFNGPSTGPKLENQTTGEYIGFDNNVVLALGDTLTLDFENGTAIAVVSGVEINVLQYAISGSKFFSLEPGDNTIQYSANVIDPDGYCTFTWRDTYA